MANQCTILGPIGMAFTESVIFLILRRLNMEIRIMAKPDSLQGSLDLLVIYLRRMRRNLAGLLQFPEPGEATPPATHENRPATTSATRCFRAIRRLLTGGFCSSDAMGSTPSSLHLSLTRQDQTVRPGDYTFPRTARVVRSL